MSLEDKLSTIQDETNRLLDYANETTGEADSSLGDAVKRLAVGYGQGGGENPLGLELVSDHVINVYESDSQYTISVPFDHVTLPTDKQYHLYFGVYEYVGETIPPVSGNSNYTIVRKWVWLQRGNYAMYFGHQNSISQVANKSNSLSFSVYPATNVMEVTSATNDGTKFTITVKPANSTYDTMRGYWRIRIYRTMFTGTIF